MAALSDDELRLAAKAAIALAAASLHNQKQINVFLHTLAAQFNQAGEKYGRDHETIVGHLNALDAILNPARNSTMQ